jgi:photosystem II stability/assembly factor-like uncharacterized protein
MNRRALALVGIFLYCALFLAEGPMQQTLPGRGEVSDAMLALDLWTASRAYPVTDISPDAYYRAFTAVRAMQSERTALRSAVPPWTSLGPANFSGRTIAIAINTLNPNTMYVGSASGGLWRSYSGGLAGDWQRVTTGFPVLGVNAIAIDPIDTGVVYIGTGEVYRHECAIGGLVMRATRGSYGLGILKTTDAGETWSKSLDWTCNQRRGVECIRINPQNPHTVLAATSEGVYRTTDAGTTWNRVINAWMGEDIAICPLDTTLVLATCGNFASTGRGVYRSTDGGATFTMISSLPSFSGKAMLEMYGANPRRVYLSLADTAYEGSSSGSGSLRVSTNFGQTWSVVSSAALYGVQGWYSQFVAVHPADSTKIVRGSQYLYKSTNGGSTQYEFPYLAAPWADFHNYAHHPIDPNILYIIDDAGVWRSTDFGTTYLSASAGLLTTQFYNGFSCSAQDSNRMIAQVQDRFGWIYTGSPFWSSGVVDEVGWTAINQQNDMIMYAGDRNGDSLFKSTNRGLTFPTSCVGLPTYTTGGWNTPFVLSPSNPNYLYFGRAIVYRSTNAAASWAATNGGASLDGNLPLSMAVAPTSKDTVFVGTASGGSSRPHLYRTTNAGTSWTNVTGTLPNRYPLDIAIDPRDARIVYVTFGGYDTTRLAKSTDGGITWRHIGDPLPNVPTNAVVIDPFMPDHIYVGDDLGVFLSTDGGVSWMSYSDGLFEAVMAGDLVVSRSNRTLRLASHGNGVFTRPLYSSVMTDVTEGSRQIPVERIVLQNFPNPFNPTTTLTYELPRSAHVRIRIFAIDGRDVATLVDAQETAGSHSSAWNAAGCASGVYFCRLEAGAMSVTTKLVILR